MVKDLGFEFSTDKRVMLERWNVTDPVSYWEKERNQRICKAQGSGNNLVSTCN